MNDVVKNHGPHSSEQPRAKRPYAPPRLIEHGKVSELTASTGSDPTDEPNPVIRFFLNS